MGFVHGESRKGHGARFLDIQEREELKDTILHKEVIEDMCLCYNMRAIISQSTVVEV